MNNQNLSQTIKDTFIYGYPIVGMYELLYSQILDPKTKNTQFNQFSHTAEVASPKTSFIPAPNNDTSYSRAWLDLRNGPVMIEMPDTEERYYSIQMLDLFSETLINVGKRTTGTKTQKFVVVGPNCNQELPKQVCVIKSNTPFVLAFLRILIGGPEDIEAVKTIQNAIDVYPLSSTPEKELFPYKNADKTQFFETLNQVLQLMPDLESEEQMIKNIAQCVSAPADLLEQSCKQALDEIDQGGMSFGEACNFWRIARIGIGNYGTDYLQRAIVWHKGALANQPVESLYPSTFQDSEGQLLDGAYDYTLTFADGQLPPVSQFWSLTMYIFDNAFLHDNEIDRYSIGDRTQGLFYDENGALTIYIQNQPPTDPSQKKNWLPAPDEKFFIVLRMYGPSEAVIDGSWQPPAVIKQDKK